MWIEQLEIRGFRRLRGTYLLNKGLTLVVGDNESGKSSLHEALIRALFGFPRGDRTRRSGFSVKDSCTPWLESDYGINAVLSEVKGRSLRVEWDFDTHRVTLLDANTGEDLSQDVRLKRDEVRLGPYLLGLTLDDFREVCCLDQAAIDAVERTENLVLALQQSIESTAHDHGVESGVAILNDRLREVGVHVATLAPSPAGALMSLMRERDVLTQQIGDADRSKHDIADKAVELGAIQDRLVTLRHEMSAIDLRLLRHEAARLEEVLEQARRLRAEAEEVVEPVAAIPQPTVERIADLTAALRATQNSIAQLQEQANRTKAVREELERARNQVERSLAAVPAHAGISPDHEAGVRRLLGHRERMAVDRTELEIPSVPMSDPLLERYRSNRSRLLELQRLADAPRWKTSRIAVAVALAVASVTLGIVVDPIYLAGLIAALIVGWTARVRAVDAHTLAATLADYGAGSIEELDQRAREEDRTITSARALVSERTRLADSLDTSLHAVDGELSDVLERAGAPKGAPLTARAERYLQICRAQLEHTQLQSRLDRVAADLAAALRPVEDLEQRRQEAIGLTRELQAAYAEVEIDEADLDQAASALRARLDRVARIERQRTRAVSAANTLRTLLGHQTIDTLANQARRARERVKMEARDDGLLDETDAGRETLLSHKSELLRDLQRLERKEAEAQTLIAAQEAALPDVPGLKERLELVSERIGRIDFASGAVRIAREALEDAARETHRKFAPYLNAALQRHLPRITDGRYVNAVVDEDLQIRVQAPETGKLVPVNVLSRGTQDQIYFIQRLEIVRLLDPTTGEAPLLLDDAFTRFDARRLKSAFGILADTALERQVVLFTEDEGMVRRAEELGVACTVIRLPAPAARAAHTEATTL
jgi:DNA repair exonuclease SbcCD ATPase subunit